MKSTFSVLIARILNWPLATVAAVTGSVVAVGLEIAAFGFFVVLMSGVGDDAALVGLPGEAIIRQFLSTYSISGRVIAIAIGIAAVSMLRGLFLFVATFSSAYVEQKVMERARTGAFDKALTLDFQAFHQRPIGDTLNYIYTCSTESSAASGALLRLLQASLLIAVYSSCLLFLSPFLTIVSTLFLVVVYIVVKGQIHEPLRKLGEKHIAINGRMGTLVVEAMSGLRAIKLFNREQACSGQHRQWAQECTATQMRHQALVVGMNPLLSSMIAVAIAATLIGGSMAYGPGIEERLPSLVLFVLILTRLSAPFQQLTQEYAGYAKFSPAVIRQQQFMSLDDEKYLTNNATYQAGSLREGIRFDDVTFQYDGAEQPSIHDFSISIPANKTTAFVGPSGAGKSTIINLLGGLLPPTSGSVLIDGVPLDEVDIRSWRERLGFVSQDGFLFNDTVAANLRFAKPEATDVEVIAAAKTAHAHEFIQRLDRGYDTIVGNNGVKLSGGQQQRLLIARAVLRQPDILILDEATSSLDSLSERAIQEAISEFSGKCTMVVIAHRLSTVQGADQIVVLDNGQISEIGNHHSLQGSEGLYSELVAAQTTV